jgi:hypothetical protein
MSSTPLLRTSQLTLDKFMRLTHVSMDNLRVNRPVSEARASQTHGRETRKVEEWRYHSLARETANVAKALIALWFYLHIHRKDTTCPRSDNGRITSCKETSSPCLRRQGAALAHRSQEVGRCRLLAGGPFGPRVKGGLLKPDEAN